MKNINNLYKYNQISIGSLIAIIIMVPTGLFFVLAPIFALFCLLFVASTSTNIVISTMYFKNLAKKQKWILFIWLMFLSLFFIALLNNEFRIMTIKFLIMLYFNFV